MKIPRPAQPFRWPKQKKARKSRSSLPTPNSSAHSPQNSFRASGLPLRFFSNASSSNFSSKWATAAPAKTPVAPSVAAAIDGIINEDRLGLDSIYLQAKRWEHPVGRPEIQKFAGALAEHRAKKGVFITTSSFTKEALASATKHDARIVLIDGEKLATLMIDHGLGVTLAAS